MIFCKKAEKISLPMANEMLIECHFQYYCGFHVNGYDGAMGIVRFIIIADA